MVDKDVCYALHEFAAENPDELSFGAGERIQILERDDQYGDGWFQGRNESGDVGLFPQSYTASTPPSPSAGSHRSLSAPPSPHPQTPEPTLEQHSNAVELALGQLSVNPLRSDARRGSFGATSIQSGHDDDDYANDTAGGAAALNPRAMLAAKAMENAKLEAQEQREREDKRRKDDEAAYLALRKDGFIEGLQMSDESDSEDEAPRKPVQQLASKSSSVLLKEHEAAPPAVSNDDESQEVLSSASTDPSVFKGGRSRSGTIASVYPDSVNSDTNLNSPPPPMPTQLSPPLSSNETSSDAPQSSGASAVTQPLAAAGAALVGMAGAAAVAAGLTTPASPTSAQETKRAASPSPSRSPSALAERERGRSAAPSPTSVRAPTPSPQKLSSPLLIDASSPASTVPARSPTPILTKVRSISPALVQQHDEKEITPIPTPAPIVPTAAPILPAEVPPHPVTPFSAEREISGGSSRASSVLAPTTGRTTAPSESGTAGLPYDPRSWGVEEVVEWGKAKGFDQLTLGKFQEHEISGDVLLEMDVAMLKEIDLTAFGRRVHIFNAIKELRARIASPASSTAQPQPHHQLHRQSSSLSHSLAPSFSNGPFSPTLSGTSGYEPDTPSTMGYQSPDAARGSGVSANGFGAYGSGSVRHSIGSDLSGRRGSMPGQEEDEENLQQQQHNLARSTIAAGPRGGSIPRQRGAPGLPPMLHTRSSTVDSFATGATTDRPIPEEEEVASAASRSPATKKGSPTFVIPTRRGSKQGKGESGDSSGPESRAKKTSSGSGFFGTTLGRSRARKPPPRVPSAMNLSDKDDVPAAQPRLKRNALASSTSSRRSTRLFGAFGGGSTGEKPSDPSRRLTTSAPMSNSGPSSMSAVTVDAVTAEMVTSQPAIVTEGNLLEKIGTPDYSGWMRKKGEKYGSWKQRFFVLKGIHLYYLKSESEQKVKGFINLTGYRVLADADIHPGEFGFKVVHDRDRTHYFSAAEQVTVRNWMKEIMKATIGRDYSAAVVSSCNIDTMPLAIAQSMSPRPRPPSPTQRAAIQKERYAGANPNTLTPKDALILMEFSTSPLLGSDKAKRSSFVPPMPGPIANSTSLNGLFGKEAEKEVLPPQVDNSGLLAWVNEHLPASHRRIEDLSMSLRSGEVLVRLLEARSGTQSNISDGEFAKFSPPSENQLFAAEYFDVVFAVFDYISPLVSTDDISMDDMLSGNEPRLVLLIERIKTAYP